MPVLDSAGAVLGGRGHRSSDWILTAHTGDLD